MKKSLPAVVAAVAAAASALLFTAPHANAAPRQTVADRIAEVKADCRNAGHTWTVNNGDPQHRYDCSYKSNGKEHLDSYNTHGDFTGFCWRFVGDDIWICY